jgi:hypothetical protein
LALPAGAALPAARPPDALETPPEWRASTVFATIKRIAARMSSKDRFIPSLTYDATRPKTIVIGIVPNAVSIRRRILKAVNEVVPQRNVKPPYCPQLGWKSGSGLVSCMVNAISQA